jgi:hypothetical protein
MAQTVIYPYFPEQGVANTPTIFNVDVSNVSGVITIAPPVVTHKATIVPCVRNNYIGPLTDTIKY